jgi:hypothetical protein
MSKKKPHPTFRNDLEALIAQARQYATHMMKTTGSVPPSLMAITPDGVMLFVPSGMGNDQAKDKFANAGRLVAIGYRATAVAMILESWATFAKRPGQLLTDVPPSQSPDREEVVVIMGETRETRAQQFLFIQRNSAGKFTGFGTSLVPQFNQMEGRFAQMLPPKVPTRQNAVMARTLLAAMGVKVANHGHTPGWN